MERGGRSGIGGGSLRPRWFLLALIVSLLVGEVGFSISGNTFQTSGRNPASLSSAIVEEISMSYTQGIRIVNGLRLIYEVHSQFTQKERAGKAAVGVSPRSEPARTCNQQALDSGRA